MVTSESTHMPVAIGHATRELSIPPTGPNGAGRSTNRHEACLTASERRVEVENVARREPSLRGGLVSVYEEDTLESRGNPQAHRDVGRGAALGHVEDRYAVTATGR